MKFYKRLYTKKINIGNVTIGGGLPIVVQSMTNTDSRDYKATIKQIKQLEDVGCEIVRISIPDMESAYNINIIKKNINIPLVADIHFNYKIALETIKQGIDKIRINPGNIGSETDIGILAKEAKKAHIPIRIGINAGSLKEFHSFIDTRSRAEVVANTAIKYVEILEKYNFEDIVVSLKTSNIYTTIQAYNFFSFKKKYPLHLGITESGTIFSGTIKSAAGLGIILYNGIGDTLRVSLTANPIEEVKVAYYLLQSMGLRHFGIEIISCPTCSRCQVDLIKMASKFEEKIATIKNLKHLKKNIKVAIMGCSVNGIGEANDADFGIICKRNIGILFRCGKIIGKVKTEKLIQKLIFIIMNYINTNEN
ncbi:MAG: flavodoxin-dependent (E)-4-hydroxy-3-methylbut-2-enyl-diphosphate synthase [Endomicrobium sp.]|jgi:(E)-4-hydroxy-3-methylbut-2-enyl-diphosphate synthase|nr:flavodoxin-dependent (E)-4-hydroxy-3-methylbut-2-enyl-diphosphate synthase [Endomicrobium sp.]